MNPLYGVCDPLRVVLVYVPMCVRVKSRAGGVCMYLILCVCECIRSLTEGCGCMSLNTCVPLCVYVCLRVCREGTLL